MAYLAESRAEWIGDELDEAAVDTPVLVGWAGSGCDGAEATRGVRLLSPVLRGASCCWMSWQSSLMAEAMLRKQYLPPKGLGVGF